MAFLMRSAAEPCTGVFMACRSASMRTWKFLALRSGRRRSRPSSVRTMPVLRALAIVSSMNARTAG
jgi:hypothetical protein